MLRNILCDRDGTIIYDKHYLCDPDGVELLPGAAAGLRGLYENRCKIFIVTNQSGIGRGIYDVEDYKACARRLNKVLSDEGVKVSDTVFCPHAPAQPGEEECGCRKPAVGMWTDLKLRHGLDEKQSVMIGDKEADILFGINADLDCTILVLSGKGVDTAAAMGLRTDHPDLVEHGFYEPPALEGIPNCVALDMEWAAAYILQKNGIK